MPKKLFAAIVFKSRRNRMPLNSKGVAIYKLNRLFLPENSLSACHCIWPAFACLTVLSVWIFSSSGDTSVQDSHLPQNS